MNGYQANQSQADDGHLLSRGIYIAPSQFESMFVSLAHSDDDIDRTVEAVGELLGGN